MGKRPSYREEDFPEPGTIFLAPTLDGRLSAGRVLQRKTMDRSALALIATSPWIGSEPPALDLPVLKETLVLNHHSWKNQIDQRWVSAPLPSSFQILGQVPLSATDLKVTCNSYGGWEGVPLQALLQWRWDHDREALLEEEARQAAELAERNRLRAAKRAEYLNSLALASLVSHNWLESWEGYDLPIEACRKILFDLVRELSQVPKVTPAVGKRLLKRSVEEFNQLDSQSRFIGTLEREDLCDAYEQIMCAAKCPQITGQIENWREW